LTDILNTQHKIGHCDWLLPLLYVIVRRCVWLLSSFAVWMSTVHFLPHIVIFVESLLLLCTFFWIVKR